jgi:phosphomannomutase
MRRTSSLKKEIFKAYDVRGIYPDELDEDAAYRIGQGFAQSGLLPRGREVAVGRDMRTSSESLFAALADGLNAGGMDVIDIGLSTTPMLYFAVNVLHTAGGVMITASHNPAEYNGFKFVREEAIPISAETGLNTIREGAFASSPERTARGGARRKEDLAARYRSFFGERFSIALDREVVIDAGNGMAGAVLPGILETQGIRHTNLFFELDGRFPHHEADPLKEKNLADLRRAMRERPGSIGIAFDGDADRVAFLDERGELVRGDLLTALIAKQLLQQNGRGAILYDLRSSRVVPEVVRACGGRPVKTRVGHSFVKARMREEKALFGGELSYHFYFSDFFYCESGILAMLHVLKIVAESGEPLAALVLPLRTYAHSGERNFPVADMQGTMKRVEARFRDGAISYLDGLSVDYDDWWFNLRPSNTEPLLRLNVEAQSEALLDEKLSELRTLLEEEIKVP